MAAIVKRGVSYYVVVTSKGRQRWHSAGVCPVAAKALSLRFEADKIDGGPVSPPKQESAPTRRPRLDLHHHYVAPESIPASKAIDLYETYLKSAGRNATHVSTTIKNCRAIFTFVGVEWADRLTLGHVDAYVLQLRAAGFASRTINCRIGAAQALLKWMVGRDMLARYILHRYPKQRIVGVEKLKRRALSAEEVTLLLACEAIPETRRLSYRVALLTGLRWSELIAMRASWIDWRAVVLTVPAEISQARRAQTIPLHPGLIQPLKSLSATIGSDVPLLPSFLPKREKAAKTLRADCLTAGVAIKHVQFHSMRHTFCTLLAVMNVHPAVLQVLARHASLDTTLRYYVHLRRVDEAAAVAGLLSV